MGVDQEAFDVGAGVEASGGFVADCRFGVAGHAAELVVWHAGVVDTPWLLFSNAYDPFEYFLARF